MCAVITSRHLSELYAKHSRWAQECLIRRERRRFKREFADELVYQEGAATLQKGFAGEHVQISTSDGTIKVSKANTHG